MDTASFRIARNGNGPAVAGPLAFTQSTLAAHIVLSPSKVNKYLDCPAAYYFKHQLQLPDPPTGPLALGSAVHGGIHLILGAKLAHVDLPSDELQVKYLALAAAHLAAAELRDDENPEDLVRQGWQLITLYRDQVVPDLRPAKLEQPVSGAIAGVPVRGVVDILDHQAELIEIKTTSRTPPNISPARALQLTTYAMLTGATKGHNHTLIRTKQPKFLDQAMPITAEDRLYCETCYSHVADAVHIGIYPPHRDSMNCSRRRCAFWRACQAEYGGFVPE